MKRIIVSVKDLKVGAMNIMTFKTEGEAIRAFGEVVSDEKTQLNKYPEDFVLLVTGEFNEDTGEITATPPKVIATGSQFIKKEE